MATKSAQRPFQACWIWGSPGLANEHRNEYVYLRKTVKLTSEPTSARVRISADNRYQLLVNGQFVCRGPARCEPKWQAYDEIDLAPFLRKGNNVLAALAHHYGESTFQSLERGGWGFLLDGEIRCKRGKPIPIHTNDSWKGIEATAYKRKTERYTVQLGFQEDFDAQRSQPGWTKLSFSDRDWPSAVRVAAANGMPYENLLPRSIPFEREEPARFVGVTGTFQGQSLPGYESKDDIGLLLAEEKRQPARKPLFRKEEAALKPGKEYATVLPTPRGKFSAIVIDAGKETSGFFQLDIEAAGGEIVDLFYSEHIKPDGEAVTRAQNGALASIADRYRCRKGRQQHQFFAWKGFRYVLVVFRDVQKPLRIHRFDYTFTSYPVERKGSFECSDDLLNTIWETGVYTQQLCMHDAYMDCPWREQAQWWGDARIQWRVNMAAFGDTALFKRGLQQAAQSQAHDGLTYGLFPCECHGCILPDYTLVWVCSIWDYYLHSGDDEPVREHFDQVVKALKWFENHAGNAHLLDYPSQGQWLFLDWAPLFKAGYSTTFTLQYLEALQVASTMARYLGRTSEARRYAQQAGQVERAAVRTFWDNKGKQFYEGCYVKGRKKYRQFAQHGNTYAILTGIQKRWHDKIADRIIWIMRNHDRLFDKNADGNLHRTGATYPIASSFFYAYVLQAMFQVGRGSDALYAIRKLWGRMLDKGATTWFESWIHGPKTYGNSSACHAWSASPTYHLSEQVGGIAPLEPGYSKVRIAPQMFDLDYAQTRVPSPKGSIEVKWERTSTDGMELQIRLPKKVEGVLDLPGRRNKKLDSGSQKISID